MLTKLDINGGQLAQLKYENSDYRILRPGTHVMCATTDRPIPLEELKYWNWERQEAYIDATASYEAEKRAGKIT